MQRDVLGTSVSSRLTYDAAMDQGALVSTLEKGYRIVVYLPRRIRKDKEIPHNKTIVALQNMPMIF